MKTLPYFLVFCMIFILISCQEKATRADHGKSIGNLHLSKSAPEPGDSIQIIYNVDNLKFKDGDVEALYYYYVNYSSYPKDIHLTEKNGAWEGTMAIPDSATAVIINFKIGDKHDYNDKKGYIQPLFNEEGEPIPGSDASLGHYYLTRGERQGLKKEKDSALALIRDDLEKHPSIKKAWGTVYPIFVYRKEPTLGEKMIKERIAEYGSNKNLTDKDYQNLVIFYDILGNETERDSIKKIALKKFPKGSTAKREIISEFLKEKNTGKQKELLRDFRTMFGSHSRDTDMMLGILANKYGSTGNYKAFTNYADQISDKSQKSSIYNNAAWRLAKKGENLDFADKISKESLDIMQSLENDPASKPDYYSESQYQEMIKSNYAMYADTYALILFKEGKKEEALKYQEKAIGDNKMGGPEVNERYIQFLLANKKPKEAQQAASRYIANNKYTPKLKEYLKEAYRTNEGSSEGYNDYLAGLQKEAGQKSLTELKEKMIDEEAYDFTLKNLKGEDVALQDFRGKTVILDFWATWCGPCKASFPGMQQAVTKYKDNPKVEFLFIDTWEQESSEERKKKVGDFITKNKYTFNVLLDTPIKEGSNNYLTTDKYGINGIPTKIILGPDGNIKFKIVGDDGNPEKLIMDIESMIGLLQS